MARPQTNFPNENPGQDSPYMAKLKDDRWQAKRGEILERDQHCTKCESEDDLQVHHTIYHPGREPWEYKNEELVTLCEDCHLDTENEIDKIKWLLGRIQQTQGVYRMEQVRVLLTRQLEEEDQELFRTITFKHG